jgi:xylan 1,4-beta-xylosidase
MVPCRHCCAFARSRRSVSPFPASPVAHLGFRPWIEPAKSGQWYLAHLCSRPVPGTRRCTLGRETALQPIEWPDGDWPCLAGGGSKPFEQFTKSASVEGQPYFDRFEDNFDGPTLSPHWNTLREPPSSAWLRLDEKPGTLRLYGRHSIQSIFEHSIVGCRVAHHRCDIRTALEYEPHSPRQRAGLALYYNTSNFYYLNISADAGGGTLINVLICNNGRHREDPTVALKVPVGVCFELHARLRDATLTFFCSVDGGRIRQIGSDFDVTTLSDDYPLDSGFGWAFTGLFAALCTQDSTNQRIPADFNWFRYEAFKASR